MISLDEVIATTKRLQIITDNSDNEDEAMCAYILNQNIKQMLDGVQAMMKNQDAWAAMKKQYFESKDK